VTHLANGGARPAYLSKSIRQIAHIPRAGAFDVHALGSLMLKRARKAGVELRYGMIDALQQVGDGYRVSLDRGDGQEDLHTQNLVLAAGPFVNDLAGMLGMNMPVESYLQRKFVIPDPLGIIPADMPFTIFADPQCLDWSEAEKHLIRDDPDYQWLLDEFPAGLHIKPESRGHIKLGWAYNRASSIPQWEVADDFDFPNVTLRGASRFIPALKPYVEQAPTPLVQFAGYYTRTRENWPLIGPLNTDGLYTVAALSGYGTMNACAAGELCAAWMTGSVLPSYAPYFHPDRYTDDAICAEMALLESDGQL
jgi:glycine/D-amino acid oxidase-like deaminating enzyme